MLSGVIALPFSLGSLGASSPLSGSSGRSALESRTTTVLRLRAGGSIPPAGPGPRDEVLPRLKEVIASGSAIVGAGAGTGISAKFEEVGGADLIIVYNSGRFRMGGHGSLAGLLPFKDANARRIRNLRPRSSVQGDLAPSDS